MRAYCVLLFIFVATLASISCHKSIQSKHTISRTGGAIQIGKITLIPFDGKYPDHWPDYLVLPKGTYIPGFGSIKSMPNGGVSVLCYVMGQSDRMESYFSTTLTKAGIVLEKEKDTLPFALKGTDKKHKKQIDIRALPNPNYLPPEWIHFIIIVEPTL